MMMKKKKKKREGKEDFNTISERALKSSAHLVLFYSLFSFSSLTLCTQVMCFMLK